MKIEKLFEYVSIYMKTRPNCDVKIGCAFNLYDFKIIHGGTGMILKTTSDFTPKED